MTKALHYLISFFAVISFTYAQEPEYLEPTQQVTYGERQHTSRDAIFFSEMNSKGELIIAGYTERDFTFSDVQIMALDKDLNVLWSDRLSWDGISYDYPMDILIDKDDNVWVVSKNLYSYYANFIVVKYDPSGKKLWEYKSPELLESSSLNMNQDHYFFDEQGYLNFNYYKGRGDAPTIPTFFRLSPQGEAVDEYEVQYQQTLLYLSNSGSTYHGFNYRYDPTEEFYYIRFNAEKQEKYSLNLSSHLEGGYASFLYGNTQSATDNQGNLLTVGEKDFHDRTGFLHKSVVVLSLDSIGKVNYAVDHDPDKDKYLLGFTITSENNLVLLTNSQPIEIEDEEPLLTLEIFSEEGELLYSKKSETAVGNLANFTDDRILVRTLYGDLQVYDYELNLLSEYEPAPLSEIFVPQDLHLMDGDPVLTGTTVAKKYETSDYYSEENFLVRKFDQNGISAQMSYNGEGTSKVMPHAMISDEAGNIIVSYEEFLGPNNISLGGSRSPKEKKIRKYSPQLELLEEKVVEDTEIWEEPKTEFTGSNGKLHSYVISEDKKSIEFYADGELQWKRNPQMAYDEEIVRGILDRDKNFVFYTRRHVYNSKIHKLTPDNIYNHSAQGNYLKSFIVLSNNWIFTFTEGPNITVYSPELKLISSKQLDLPEDHHAHLMEKNNKVLFNTLYGDLVLVLDQFGNEETRFKILGDLYGSTAFFDENDALVVNHTIGEGIYLAHGHNWTRGAISRYENIMQFIGEYNDGDSDGDGIPDDLDRCPDTPRGAEVDDYGCELLKLDSDHFRLKVKNETCPGKNNGRLEIAAKEAGSYLLELGGVTYSFATYMHFEMLPSGDYELCVWMEGETQTRQCFEFTIDSGQQLEATTTQSSTSGKKQLAVNILQGTAPFNVMINGRPAGTFSNSVFSVPVNSGDEVEVSTAVGCEGGLEVTISSGEEMSLYPNPVGHEAELLLTEAPSEDFLLEILNISGQRVRSFWQKSGVQKITIPAEDLGTGIYIIRLHLREIKNIKMIKS